MPHTVDLSTLSTSDKLELIQDLWDNLRAEADMPITHRHRKALRETRARVEAGLETPIPLKEVERRLQQRIDQCK